MTIVERTDKYIDLTGIRDHTVNNLNIVHAAFVAKTHTGYAIFHVYQAAYMEDGKSILAPLQMETFGGTVCDKSKKANNGEQPYFQSHDGHKVPMSMRQGLMYIDVRPVRDSEWGELPHVHLTSDSDWDPSEYDHEVDPDWSSITKDTVSEHYADKPYDTNGDIIVEE